MNPGVGGRDDDLSELSSMAEERSTEAFPPSPPPPLRSPTPKLKLPHALLAAATSDSSPGAGDYPGEPPHRSADSAEETPEKKTADKGKDGAPCALGSWKDRKAARKIPFHIPTITKPQVQFGIMVNNSNWPFDHVWLERSPDGRRFVHPLEKLHVLNLVDRNFEEGEQMKPLPVEGSPFKLVEVVPELKALASKLQDVNEFAVDLEHNQYRSFQGLTCLMQISTRTEDFVIDTLKLRVHVGPYLREVFKDPSKRKVMHGADRDILWLQRDFGIYVCNLFDTGQASRLMKLERNSLEYLLHHFCGIDANKEYQNADWRLRPLPEEMLKYAREDTHYLLYIYDVMRKRLISESPNERGDDLLVEVYKRSYDICVQLYEKEIFTDRSYLSIYGLQEAGFNSQQLAIVSGLYEWRDNVARAQDESTGYILPNKALLEIAKQMPLSSSSLRPLMKSRDPYMEHYLSTVIEIIIKSKQNAAAFEHAPEQLKKVRQKVSSSASVQMFKEPTGGSEASTSPEFKPTREFIGEQEKAASELKQIKSLATLPYYPLSWGRGHANPYLLDSVSHQYPEFPHQFFNQQAGITGSELVRMPHTGDNSLSSIQVPAPGSNDPWFRVSHPPGYGFLQAQGPLPVSGPSFSFTEFYEPMNETGELRQDQGTHQETDQGTHQETETYFSCKTFDYDAARK